MRFLRVLGFLILGMSAWSVEGKARTFTDEQAIKCIMGEARGEPYEGQVAVGEVLRNRNSLNGFYGYTAKFKATQKEIETAERAWKDSRTWNYSQGATHFEGDSFKRPYWIKEMKEVAHIGHQRFFKERKL